MPRTTRYPSTAGFIVDPNSIDRSSGRQIDWANIGNRFKETPGTAPVTIVVGAAGAAGGATSVPVAALTADGAAAGAVVIPSGTTISLGTNKFVRLTADALLGATTLTVAAIPTALVSGDTGTYAGAPGSGNKYLPAGTVVGELLGSGKISPRIVTTNPAVGILETEAVENDYTAAATGYGMIVGGEIYEALLPDASGGPPRTLATAIKTELNTAGASKGFLFQLYTDSR